VLIIVVVRVIISVVLVSISIMIRRVIIIFVVLLRGSSMLPKNKINLLTHSIQYFLTPNLFEGRLKAPQNLKFWAASP